MSGRIYCGDNLEVLREFIPDSSVDLVYLDPPFNSQRNYHVVYEGSQALEQAFKDCWSWDEAAPAFAQLVEDSTVPKGLKSLLRSLKELLGENDSDLLAYLSMMTPRLLAIHRALKGTGSMYLHCDPTASHYLKLVLDSIFGSDKFQSEIIWQRSTGKSLSTRKLPNNHDVILVYRKGEVFTWNADEMFVPYDVDNLEPKTAAKYSHRDPDGRRYRLDNLINPNRDRPNLTYEFLGVTRVWRWTKDRMKEAHANGLVIQTKPGTEPQFKRYLDEQRGRPLGDVWTDIAPLNSQAAERTNYPTQKPLALLERVIRAASKPGDLVLDPFCGCGTTVESAERHGRKWIGIDIAPKAVEVISSRFERVELAQPEIIWHPADEEAAKELAKANKLDFEKWVLRKVKAAKQRKHDRGIDGESNYKDGSKSYHVLVSVKGGAINPGMMRDLVGTVHRVQADIGVMVTLLPPSKEMKREATEAGFLNVSDERGLIPRIQIATVAQLFSELKPIRVPGENKTVMPKKTLPPVAGTQLSLDIQGGAGSANDNGAGKSKRPSLPGGPRKTQPAPSAAKAKPKSAPPARRRSSR